jgi:hypothetical protein
MWIFLDCILQKSSRQRNILWRIDNTTALAYVKKEGGTCSPQVLEIAEKFLVKAHQIPSASFRSSFPQGKTSWQTQLLTSKRFQMGSFISPKVGLHPRIRFSPIPLLKRVVKKLETSKGTFILVSPLWEA